jgi:hypothetical protein
MLVLGSSALIDDILLCLGLTRQVIVLVLFWLCSLTVCGLRKDWAMAKEVLNWHGPRVVSFLDSNNGGTTDACYMFGFGRDVVAHVLWCSTVGLPRTLCHFLGGGAVGFFPIKARIPCSSIPTTVAPPRKVLWHLDVALGEGLFSCSMPLSAVYCPSHFFLQQWIKCPLSITKLLHLHQVLLKMDPLLQKLSPVHGLPFADSAPSDLFVSFF